MIHRPKDGLSFDPFDEDAAREEAPARPLRARRLVDLLDGEQPRPTPPPPPRGGEVSLPAHGQPAPLRAVDAAEPAADSVPVAGEYALLSVTPDGEGETMVVVLSIPASSESAGGASTRSRIKLHLLAEQYVDLISAGIPLCPGTLTCEQTDQLMEAGKLCAAIRRGMMLLQYGDCSARRLAYKLTAKGVEREAAEAATAYLAEKGYLREDDAAIRRAEQGIRKGWGIRRIRDDLRAHGYSAEAVEEALGALDEVDTSSQCAQVIRKKYGSIPSDAAERRKMIAALLRQGYGMDEIRAAMEMVLREGC